MQLLRLKQKNQRIELTLTRDLIERLPKAELHVHLDGCLRPATMLDIAREEGISLPADSAQELARKMFVGNAASLEEYLESYVYTLSVMQSASALERIAYEFVVDAAAHNTRYIEVRYCPTLHTENGLNLVDAIEAPLVGFRRADADLGTTTRVIISALRTHHPDRSMDLAKAAVDYSNDGVVAFDLAGAERGHPAREHASAFDFAIGHGLQATCHAGEGAGPYSVKQALEDCKATRIGHGVRILEDPEVEEYVRQNNIALEVCLTSNVHTHTVVEIEKHPIRRYFDEGCAVTINTDSRLMDDTDITTEFMVAHEKLGFTRPEIEKLILTSVQNAFLPDSEKQTLVEQFKKEMEEVQ